VLAIEEREQLDMAGGFGRLHPSALGQRGSIRETY
jgi:hypothetical protein